MRKILFCLLMIVGYLSSAELVLIAHPTHQGAVLSKQDVAAVYTGRIIAWPDGTKISPVYMTSGVIHEDFLLAYVGKSVSQFNAIWKKLVFTGKSSMPDTCTSEAAMIATVKATPGALGYAERGTLLSGVAVITVE